MSTNDRVISGYDHPADDPAQIAALRLAVGLGDRPVAHSIGRDVLAARIAWERAQHPTGRGACDPEEAPCSGCAAAYSEPDARDIEEDETT
jgi:hypothetical protein